MADGMATANHVGFLEDKRLLQCFQESWDGLGNQFEGEKSRFPQTLWRAHIVTWCFNQARSLPGDFVECGTWYGTLMKTACSYHNFNEWPKQLILADSWINPYSPSNTDIYEDVTHRFSKFKNVKLVRGELPNSLPQILDSVTSISFLALDLNDGPTERIVLETLWERLEKGAIVYLDDYGGNSFIKVRQEIDEFLRQKSETLVHFPNQVSLLIKQ
jgi:O-methyltransferase